MLKKKIATILLTTLTTLPSMAQEKHFINTGNPFIKHIHTADPAPMVDGDTLWVYAGSR